jgi:hypothetical protein
LRILAAVARGQRPGFIVRCVPAAHQVRETAHVCLLVVAEAAGCRVPQLLLPRMDKVAPGLEKRRLLPMKHLALLMATAANLVYCLRQRPALVKLSQVLVPVHW